MKLFSDELVSVSAATVECGGARYQVSAIAGVRIAAVRHNAAGRLIGYCSLLVVCNYAVCAVVSETVRSALLWPLALAALSLTWAYRWAPELFYVMLNVSGQEVALVRYRTKSEALACVAGIEAALDAPRQA